MKSVETAHLLPEVVVERVSLLPLHLPLVLARVAAELPQRVRVRNVRAVFGDGIVVDDGAEVRDGVGGPDEVPAHEQGVQVPDLWAEGSYGHGRRGEDRRGGVM